MVVVVEGKGKRIINGISRQNFHTFLYVVVLEWMVSVQGLFFTLKLLESNLRVFKVRYLHIPVNDWTPLEGLLKIIENTLELEHNLYPNKPIYLVAESLGGCLALAVAARNPFIDLILIISNPATSFGKSLLQPLLPILETLPNDLRFTIPYLLNFVMGDPMKDGYGQH